MQLRNHRSAFDDDRLRDENAEQDKDDDDQKDVAKEFKALRPKPLPRLALELLDFDIAVVRRRNKPEIVLVFSLKIEHNLTALMQFFAAKGKENFFAAK